MFGKSYAEDAISKFVTNDVFMRLSFSKPLRGTISRPFKKNDNTNCKMNKVVLELYKSGKKIDIYFYETTDYKNVELKLLKNIKTRYNSKDN